MLRPLHPLSSLLRMGSIAALVVAASACDSLVLSSDSPSFSGGASQSVPDASSSSDAGYPSLGGDGADAPSTLVDAGMASTSVGNPLCFFAFEDGGAHECEPDTSGQCDSVADDAGTFTGWDAGVAPERGSDGGDGGDDDAAAPGPPLSACHVIPNGQMCTVAGAGGDGAQCQMGTDCMAGFECVGSPGQCRHYCCAGNASCDLASDETAGATFCDVQPIVTGGRNVPVCEPVTSCTLLAATGYGSCPKGATCAVVKDDGTTSCVEIGTLQVGGDCEAAHCAAGLTCLGAEGKRTCFQLCELEAPACPSEETCKTSAQLFTNGNVGICQ
jgi:hypothetical protein